MKVSVITISDRAFKGEYKDLSGPAIVEMIKTEYPDVEIKLSVVPDEIASIQEMFAKYEGVDWIITTGGTGVGPRDVTPEITRDYCDKEVPGIAEMIRMESYKETKNAMLSRGYSGIKGHTMVVNFPGSEKAVRFCTKIILPILNHSIKMIEGKGH